VTGRHRKAGFPGALQRCAARRYRRYRRSRRRGDAGGACGGRQWRTARAAAQGRLALQGGDGMIFLGG